jgi:hypothetical protein
MYIDDNYDIYQKENLVTIGSIIIPKSGYIDELRDYRFEVLCKRTKYGGIIVRPSLNSCFPRSFVIRVLYTMAQEEGFDNCLKFFLQHHCDFELIPTINDSLKTISYL